MKKIFLSLCLALLSLAAWAQSFTVGGVTYSVISEDELTVNITGYTSDFAGELRGTVDYNDKTYKVATIGDKAFYNCKTLTSVGDMPYVITIGNDAFRYCKTLASVGDMPYVTEFRNSVFSGCTALVSVGDMPNLSTMNGGCFTSCSSLKTIGDLSSLIYLENTTNGGWSFSGCSSLTSISLPKCQRIGISDFRNCTSLTSIGDLSKCTSIESSAFNGCTALTSVSDLPKCISIGSEAFCNCTSLTSFGGLSNCTSIKSSAFNGCTALTTVGDLSSCTSIGDKAFRDCKALTSVGDLSNCVGIGDEAFYGCVNLKSIILSKITTIGIAAFSDCSTLTSVGDLSNCTSIDYAVFRNCYKLTSVGDLSNFTSIGDYTFYCCSSLSSVGDLPNCSSIGNSAFFECKALTSIGGLPNCTSIEGGAFFGCTALASVGDLPNCTNIASQAFYTCTALTSVGDLSSCTSIGGLAFYGCSSLSSVGDLENCTNIGKNAFGACRSLKEVVLRQDSVKADGAPSTSIVFRVPQEYLEDFRAVDGWKDIQAHILPIEATTDYILTTSARESTSDILAQLGEDALPCVMKLKVSGTINSYDIMMMRNKMVNLTELDLSEASIVANPYEYYTGYHSEDSILGSHSFYGCKYLRSVVLPASIKEIGESAFEGSNLTSVTFAEGLKTIGSNAFRSTNLRSIVLPKGLKTIASQAFASCNFLTDVTFPEGLEIIADNAFSNSGLTALDVPSGLKTIGSYAFNNCAALTSVSLSKGLTKIQNNAFNNCTALTSVKLPVTLLTIGSEAFAGCSALKDFKIPSSITSIGDQAFSGCTALNDIYTWTVEPVSIGQNTFATYQTATIHTPAASHDNYYLDTQWSQFQNRADFDEPYEYFYINNDYTLDDDHNGRIDGTPDADLNEGSGLIVEGSTNQNIDSLNVKDDGNGKGASVIGEGNIEAGKLVFNIKIKAGRWHFFCFPFDIKLSEIVPPGINWVFRYYDGAERARSGKGGWKDLPDDDKEWLHAGRGYIFQCSEGGTLKINVQKEKFGKFEKHDVSHEMDTYTAGNAQDASWNFMGNPFLSYYDMDDLYNDGYDAPITRWNGSGYEAVRPGDDDYCFHPFEAFFVQKPENISSMDFKGDKRTTYRQNQQKQTDSKSKGLAREVSADRMIVNLELTDGKTTDKTRVVLNEKKSEDYEIGCDAAKFLTTGKPQLYTTDLKAVRYAINERPAGDIRLGYVAPRQGEYTITAPRMDCPMMLVDQLRGTTFDLTLGAYTFQSEAGSNDTRFLLVKNTQVEGVSALKEQTGVSVLPTDGGLSIKGADNQDVSVYTVAGTLVNRTGNGFTALQSGTYIVKVGNASAKVYIK